jgi:hypothetical protein
MGMKKLAIIVSLALSAPVLACPNMDHDEAPKTADKDKAKKEEAPKAKEQQKQEKQKDQPADTAKSKDKDKEPKKGDKVSLK